MEKFVVKERELKEAIYNQENGQKMHEVIVSESEGVMAITVDGDTVEFPAESFPLLSKVVFQYEILRQSDV